MKINGVLLKKKTLYLLGLLAAGSVSAQVGWTEKHLMPWLAQHPHLAPLGGGIMLALSLIHNPVAQRFWGVAIESGQKD